MDQALPLMRRSFVPECKAIDVERRQATHVISTDSIDRMGDIVDAAGWDTEAFERNPVVLADHDYQVDRIIGRAVSLSSSRDSLVATTEFHDVGLGAAAFNLVQAGMAKAWSVGFKPKAFHTVAAGAKSKCRKCLAARDAQVESKGDDADTVYIRGTHFVEQELLEYSLVAIPMNPDAVMAAVSRGMCSQEQVPELFSVRNRAAVDQLVEKILVRGPERAAAASAGNRPKAAPSPSDKWRSRIRGSLLRAEKRLVRLEAGTQLTRTLQKRGIRQ